MESSTQNPNSGSQNQPPTHLVRRAEEIVATIATHNSPVELVGIGHLLDDFLRNLITTGRPVEEILRVASDLNDRLTRRVIDLCLQAYTARHGEPPVSFCWLQLGSAGRCEQALRTDQDNAIIFASQTEEEENPGCTQRWQQYFLPLAACITSTLADCGFNRCRGGVMADNPQWCRSLEEWQWTVKEWLAHPDPENIRRLTIFLDFRPLYGQSDLAYALRAHIFEVFRESMTAAHFLTHDDIINRPPINLFGNFITEKSGRHRGEINLKGGAAVHIVNCMRIFSLKYRVTATSTLERLDRLTAIKALAPEDATAFRDAFCIISFLRLRENLAKISRGEEADSYVNPEHLSPTERRALKEALRTVQRLQRLTEKRFYIPNLRYLSR